MDTELKNRALEIIDLIQYSAETQLPDLARQIVNYGLASYLLGAVVFSILASFFIFLLRKVWKLGSNGRWDSNHEAGVVICGAVAIILFVGASCCLNSLLYVWLAPKAYVLQEVTELFGV